ncbi:hypothetical protein IWQ60_006506 [Tieghemiomyces parasiticus]|uniref:HhH-GPD domain-containing protein n=1 Tax=Tieghemiomyces parasiticus TaxID=78921 RepID=A0A9W8AAB8_9FUNG|nr:hypothetical protein IWQ60_006506 [Tieghemiomyces parasiticus]
MSSLRRSTRVVQKTSAVQDPTKVVKTAVAKSTIKTATTSPGVSKRKVKATEKPAVKPTRSPKKKVRVGDPAAEDGPSGATIAKRIRDLVETRTALTGLTSIPTGPPTIDAGLAHLARVEPALADFIKTRNPHAVFAVEHPPQKSIFASLVKSIVYQQIHGKAAASIFRRFLGLFQPPAEITTPEEPITAVTWDVEFDRFPAPADVVKLSIDDLRTAGLSNQKASYIMDLAQRFHSGEIDADKLLTLSDEEISKALCRVKGIGPWTADMFLMFYLQRLDVFPVLDFGVRKGMRQHFGLPAETKTNARASPTHQELTALAEAWKPYRSLGSWYMWQLCDVKTVED